MRIIKVGGKAQEGGSLTPMIAACWTESPGSLCIVHGGGNEISETQRRLGLQPQMKNGRRVTTAEDLLVVRMVLSGLVNKRLVSALVREGITAVGVSGEDGGLMRAEPRDADSYGLVGSTPGVNPSILFSLLLAGILPVISPVSACSDRNISDALNVNGDDAAAAIAVAMNADELLFVSDVSGVRESSGVFLRSLEAERARELIDHGTAAGGMAAKLESALLAIEGGVDRVRIGGIEMLQDAQAGTLVSSEAGAVR